MPDLSPLFDAGAAIEKQLAVEGLSLDDLKRPDRSAAMVELRREIAQYLTAHGWSPRRIGEFLNRDRTTVTHLLKRAA